METWNDSLGGTFLWTNSNFCEAISDVLTPATYSMWKIYMEAVPFQIPGYPLVGVIGGRPYINLSLLVSVGRVLGMKPKAFVQRLENLWGRIPEGVDIPLLPFTTWQLLRLILPNLVKVRMALNVKRGEIQAFITTCPRWCDAMHLRIRQAATPVELVNLWQTELRPYFGQAWRMGRAALEANLIRRLKRDLIDLVGAVDASALLSSLGGSAFLASLGPLVGISEVARGQMSREEYLQRYGHRGPHELEVSFPRPAEDPRWFDHQLAMFVKSPVDIEALLEKQRVEFEAAWKRFVQLHPRRTKSIRQRIEQVAASTRLREEARSEATRVIWVVREFAIRVSVLVGFEIREDVYFLSLDEMIQVLSGNKASLALVPSRREMHACYSALPPYPAIIIGRFDPIEWAADPNRRSDLFDARSPHSRAPEIITGFPGAVGAVEGLVRRLDSPDEGDELEPAKLSSLRRRMWDGRRFSHALQRSSPMWAPRFRMPPSSPANWASQQSSAAGMPQCACTRVTGCASMAERALCKS